MQLDTEALQNAIDFFHSRGAESVRVFRHDCLAAEGRLDEQLKDVPRNTLRAIMEMASGIHQHLYDVFYPGFPTLQGHVDRVREALVTPIDDPQRTRFVYQGVPLSLMLYCVERAVDQDVQQFAQKELFDPLGIPRESWFWIRDRAGHTDASHEFFGTHLMQAKLGQLLLQNGRWRGRQLISEDWVRQMHTPSPSNPAYGLLTWINTSRPWTTAGSIFEMQRTLSRPLIASAPADMYMSYGYEGIHSFVMPSLDMVVTTAFNFVVEADASPEQHIEQGEAYHEFFRRLMRAVTDRHVPDPGPWHDDPLSDPHNLQPDGLTHPDDLTRPGGLPPGAAPGCNVLGCDGQLSTEGTRDALMDSSAAYRGSAPRMAADVGGHSLMTRPEF